MSQPLIGSWIDADALAEATRELGGSTESAEMDDSFSALTTLSSLGSLAPASEAPLLGEGKVAEVRAQLSQLHARASRAGLLGAGSSPLNTPPAPILAPMATELAKPVYTAPAVPEYRPTHSDRLRRLIDWHGWLCDQESLRGLFIIAPSGELLFEIGMRPDWWFALREKLATASSPAALALSTASLHWWKNQSASAEEVGWVGWIDDSTVTESPLFTLMNSSFPLAWGASAS
jgi:hypothetical protein